MEAHEKICRLCLTNCGNDFKCIDENARELLVFLLKSNQFIYEEAVMCANCVESIKYCSEFKTICLDVQGSIAPLFNHNENDAKLEENQDGHNICGLCMGSFEVCSFTSSDSKLKDVTPNRIMLNTCLPELDWRATDKPMICIPCYESLQRYSSFITNFSIVEEKIKKYCEAAGIDATSLIRLKHVLEFTTKNTLGIVDKIKVEDKFFGDEFVDDHKCGNELYGSENMSTNTDVEEVNTGETFLNELDCKIELKPEDLMKMEDQQLNDVPNFTIQREEDDDQVNLIKMEHSYWQERVNEIEPKQENFNSLQDCGVLPQMNFNLPKMQECSLPQPEGTLPQISFVKSDGRIINRPLKRVSAQENASGRRGQKLINEKSSKIYHCEHCSFETKHRQNLKIHVLCHKNPSETTMYQCQRCTFQTKYKHSLKSHLLIHKSPSETTMYKCKHCSFQTKYKYTVKIHCQRMHWLVYEDPSEITMYQCEHCMYQTERKEALKRHLLTHENPSETIMYQCEHCSFQTKRKKGLTNHLLIHKNLSEITMYQCEQCSFQTKYKYHVKKHLLTHKNPSEINMYRCEHCSFQTKRKDNLKRHLLTHKSPSKLG